MAVNISSIPRVAADLIPEEYQNRLLYWRDVFREGQFGIGDVANELVAMHRGNVPAKQVFDAVGRFCGKSGRTVRYYAETAGFFPLKVRESYDMLPFSHFVFAKSMGEQWLSVLDFAAGSPSISEAALRIQFLGLEVPGESGDDARDLRVYLDRVYQSICYLDGRVDDPDVQAAIECLREYCREKLSEVRP